MGMMCQRFHFLSLGIWGRLASPLTHGLIFPLTAYGQCARHSWVSKGHRRNRNLKSNFYPGRGTSVNWQSSTLTTRPPCTTYTPFKNSLSKKTQCKEETSQPWEEHTSSNRSSRPICLNYDITVIEILTHVQRSYCAMVLFYTSSNSLKTKRSVSPVTMRMTKTLLHQLSDYLI